MIGKQDHANKSRNKVETMRSVYTIFIDNNVRQGEDFAMGKLSAGSSVHTRKPKLALISLNCSSPNFNTLLAGSHNLDLVLCSIVV